MSDTYRNQCPDPASRSVKRVQFSPAAGDAPWAALHDLVPGGLTEVSDLTAAAEARGIAPRDVDGPPIGKRVQSNAFFGFRPAPDITAVYAGRIAGDEPDAPVAWHLSCRRSGAPLTTRLENIRPADMAATASALCTGITFPHP